MAEDTMTEAVVISPLVANALKDAGLLGGKGDTQTPPPPAPPNPPRSVGDQASLFPLIGVAKTFETQPKDLIRFTLTEARRNVKGDEHGGDFDLDFPPNDKIYVPELERLLTAALSGGTIHARANVEITAVNLAGAWYSAKLRGLWVYGASQ
jgi:hypothetical protein